MNKSIDSVKRGFAQMLKGGVILDVTTSEEAKLAEQVGAVAVLVVERFSADIRGTGYIMRLADPKIISDITKTITIPIIAKVRPGHTSEAQVLEHLNIDMIDESEVMTPACDRLINKKVFSTPFVCGAHTLSGALKRIEEGASMIRICGDSGSGNVSKLINNVRTINQELRHLVECRNKSVVLEKKAEEFDVDYEIIETVSKLGRLPVITFGAGGISTPSDISLAMQLGCDGVFVGSGVFKAHHPDKMAKAMVLAADNYSKPDIIAKITSAAGRPMVGKYNSKD
ncbi:pyridoxal 5'-phosphate synthase lyase subunit PdxS [Candidatus Undinarchaeota archaeon]